MKENYELKIECENDKISIFKRGWNAIGFVDNKPELLELLKNNKWSINNGYIYCNKLKDYLHRIVFANIIGKDKLVKLTKEGFVVDHINNSEPFNCCKDNLHLISDNLNKAKGLTVDKDIELIRSKVAIGVYCLKDDTYQITLGFNKSTKIIRNDGKEISISIAYLNFDNFDKCYIALHIIIAWAKDKGKLNFNQLQTTNIRIYEAIDVKLIEEEIKNNALFIKRNGKTLLKLNDDITKGTLCRIYKVPKKE